MKAVVTGGAGFIGSHLVDNLLKDGWTVGVVDNLSLGRMENLKQCENNDNFSFYKKDICESDLDGVFGDADVVFHLAAIPKVQFSIENPIESHRVNVEGTLNVLNTCRKLGINRLVFPSSSAVYGDQEKLPVSEDHDIKPNSPYAVHKAICERYCNLFTSLCGLECIVLRCFNVFGPRQDPEGDYASVIPKFIMMVKQGKSPTIYGDGEQTRDFVFVDDVVDAMMRAGTTNDMKCFGGVFNIGSGTSITVNELAESIMEVVGNELEIEYGESVVEVRHSSADISKASEFLGWEPERSLMGGLEETWEYYK